jgi:hypothetical protein
MNANDASGWRIIAASAPGSAHLERGLPCQDAYGSRVLPGRVLLAAVSDGAGSAERSGEGARLAVDAALTGLDALWQGGAPEEEAGWQAAIRDLFGAINQELTKLTEDTNAPLREFAATLTCALATDEGLVVGQIGDGAAIAESVNGALFLTARPQRGEYANEVNFLTQPDVVDCTTVYAARRPVRALALTTDGLLRLAFKLPGYEPYPGFFQPLLAFARETADEAQAQTDLDDFLASERVCTRSDDDKTLLLAVRSDRPGGPAGRKARRRKDDRL